MTENQIAMVDDLLRLEEGLTSKEIKFIESLSESYQTEPLSDKQLRWLESISDHLL